MSTVEKPNRPTVFAMGVVIGACIMLIIAMGDASQLHALPIKYEHCTNNRGVATVCEVRARFYDKAACDDYRKHVWGDHEPDDIRSYCR